MTASKNPTPDMFEGIFDNLATGRREVYRNGRLARYARKNALQCNNPTFSELGPAWGAYPDVPAHLTDASKEQAG